MKNIKPQVTEYGQTKRCLYNLNEASLTSIKTYLDCVTIQVLVFSMTKNVTSL